MSVKKIQHKLSYYRFEILLFALLLLLFDKIFFPDTYLYLNYIWPINMILLGVASIGIYNEHRGKALSYIKNTSSILSIIMPFLFEILYGSGPFIIGMSIFFILYYSLLFGETFRQITRKNEVNYSVILGAMCGYLLLVLISLFMFLMIEYIHPRSFSNISYGNLPLMYNELSYFSFTLITSTGFGDITPLNDVSRLSSSFFSVIGQFYMVALVGVIVSKFSSKEK